MTYKSKIKYNAKYDKNNTTRVSIKLNNNTDSDILEFLESVENKQGLIKELLRKEIKSRKIETDKKYEVTTNVLKKWNDPITAPNELKKIQDEYVAAGWNVQDLMGGDFKLILEDGYAIVAWVDGKIEIETHRNSEHCQAENKY